MGASTYGYEYDPIGNRITASGPGASSTYSANALNQYTSVADGVTVVPGYDADGNMTSYGPRAYTWDAENRLANVFSNGVLIAANAYDHQSRRIRKTVGDDAHIFLYDGWNMTAEMTVNTATLATNITCYGWCLDLSGSLQGAGGVGGLLSVTTVSLVPAISLNTYYPAFDANGNVTAYLDSTGATAASFEYDAFGNSVFEDMDIGLNLSFRFSTKYWDSEMMLYYFGWRFFSSDLSRWVSRDPIGERGGINLYHFLYNDGLKNVDVLGLKPIVINVEKCQAVLFIGHGGHTEHQIKWKFPESKDDPNNCAVGGAIVCFPLSNNPEDPLRQWPMIPQHDDAIGWGLVAEVPGAVFGDNQYFGEPFTYERGTENIIDNAMSDEAKDKIMDKLCDDCDEVTFVFITGNKPFFDRGYMKKVQKKTSMKPNTRNDKVTIPCCPKKSKK